MSKIQNQFFYDISLLRRDIMILIADSESSCNFASTGCFMTYFRPFGGFCVEKSLFSEKQDFPVGGQKNALWDDSTPASKIHAEKYLP